MIGYHEASKLDRLTNKLLENEPITKDNVLEWMKYARTVRTTMDIIMDECRQLLSLEINK